VLFPSAGRWVTSSSSVLDDEAAPPTRRRERPPEDDIPWQNFSEGKESSLAGDDDDHNTAIPAGTACAGRVITETPTAQPCNKFDLILPYTNHPALVNCELC